MGSAVRFWRMPEEETDLVEYLESGERIVAVAYRTFPTPDDVRWLPVREAFASTDYPKFLIAPARFSSAARIEWVERYLEQGYAVDAQTSPVLYYKRGEIFDNNRLASTSFNVSWDYLTEDKTVIRDHPTDFIRW